MKRVTFRKSSRGRLSNKNKKQKILEHNKHEFFFIKLYNYTYTSKYLDKFFCFLSVYLFDNKLNVIL